MKCLEDERFSERNAFRTKCLRNWNVFGMKCLPSSEWNVFRTKCLRNEMSSEPIQTSKGDADPTPTANGTTSSNIFALACVKYSLEWNVFGTIDANGTTSGMRIDSCAYKLPNLYSVVRSPPGIIMIYRVERLVIPEMESLELVITSHSCQVIFWFQRLFVCWDIFAVAKRSARQGLIKGGQR